MLSTRKPHPAGNGTIDGAKAAGIRRVRIIESEGDKIAVRRTGLSEEQKVGLALADNRTADLSEWDLEMLHRLSEEHELDPWFNQDDLDELLNVVEVDPVEGNTDPDAVPDAPEEPITKPGDLWILGNHRLLCGDSTNPQHVERLMDGKKAEMVFTDPPYGVSQRLQGRKIQTMSLPEKPAGFSVQALPVASLPHPQMLLGLSGTHAFQREFENLRGCAITVRQQIIWVKGEGREGTAEVAAPAIGRSDFRWLHEPCFYASPGKPFNAGDRKTTTVWTVTRQTTGTVHPTQKPTDLIKIALENSSKAGQLTLISRRLRLPYCLSIITAKLASWTTPPTVTSSSSVGEFTGKDAVLAPRED